jgi:hypothetical protein
MWMDGWVDGWMGGGMDDTHYALEHAQVQPVNPTNNGHRHTSCCLEPAPVEPVNPINGQRHRLLFGTGPARTS